MKTNIKVYMYDEEEKRMEEYGEIIENGKIKYLMEYEPFLRETEGSRMSECRAFKTWIDVVLHLQRTSNTLELDKCDWGDIKLKAMNELSTINLSVYQEALEAFKSNNNTNGQ